MAPTDARLLSFRAGDQTPLVAVAGFDPEEIRVVAFCQAPPLALIALALTDHAFEEAQNSQATANAFWASEDIGRSEAPLIQDSP